MFRINVSYHTAEYIKIITFVYMKHGLLKMNGRKGISPTFQFENAETKFLLLLQGLLT